MYVMRRKGRVTRAFGKENCCLVQNSAKSLVKITLEHTARNHCRVGRLATVSLLSPFSWGKSGREIGNKSGTAEVFLPLSLNETGFFSVYF